ncbi:MAG: hypothetical protein GAK37_01254 [Pseudomonas sp.]|nr:MAG: hypothetical protein GAK37_01254 [Pseudomonas sp.]
MDRVVVCIHHQQQRGIGAGAADAGFLGAAVQQHAQAAAVAVLPLLGGHLVAVRRKPRHVLDPDVFVVVAHQKTPAPQDRIRQAQLDQAFDEREQRLAIIVQVPVDPADLAVLAVRVVVAVLGAGEFISGHHHRRTLGQQQGGEEIAHLAQAQRIDRRIVRGAFHAVVPGQVVVAAVLVVFVVVFVVLVVVRHQVVQGETVVGGDEIHRAVGPAATLVEHLARGRQAPGEVGELAVVAFPECTHGVAKAVVPLGPARREPAHLITAGAAVPGLGDKFDLAQHRVLVAGHKEAVALVEAFAVAPQNGRQVEAETVHVHFRGPVAQ